MNTLFVIRFCGVCSRMKDAVIEANLRLPTKYKIDIVDIYSGDPRCNFLAKMYGTDNPDKWLVPVLLFFRPIVQRRFGILQKELKPIVIHGYQGKEYLIHLLDRLSWGNA